MVLVDSIRSQAFFPVRAVTAAVTGVLVIMIGRLALNRFQGNRSHVQLPPALTNKVLVMMRGLPGSGKSSLAKQYQKAIPGAQIVSTDHRFMQKGKYCFNREKLASAHEETKSLAKQLFAQGTPVIVDNCNVQNCHMQDYILSAHQFGYQVLFAETHTWWAKLPLICWLMNTHKVPYADILAMSRRWETVSLKVLE